VCVLVVLCVNKIGDTSQDWREVSQASRMMGMLWFSYDSRTICECVHVVVRKINEQSAFVNLDYLNNVLKLHVIKKWRSYINM
jgi:hypothetical protein